MVLSTSKSIPVQKCLPSPRRTMTLTSFSSWRTISGSWRHMSRFCAPRPGGPTGREDTSSAIGNRGKGGGGKSGPAGRGGGGHRTHHRVAALGPVEGDETHEIVIAPRHFKVRLVDHRDNPRLPPLYFCHLRSSCKFSRGNAKKEQVFPGKTRSGYWARASEATWSGAGDAGRGTADGMGGSDAEGSSAKRAKTSEPEEEEEDPLVRRREELVVAAKEARSREDARAERVAKERVVDLVR